MHRLTPGLLLGCLVSLPAAGCGGDDTGDDGGTPGADAAAGSAIEVGEDIEADTTWTADKVYHLVDNVFVRDATLTIEQGTRVIGDADTALVITRSARLDAAGTAAEPIVFTSSQPEGARGPGDWGGVVLLGSAPINVVGGSDSIEGFPAGTAGTDFGGDDPAHDCGRLTYVRIEFAGFELSADNELNGLTVGGCGTDTELDHIQVHKGADDGIEFFGGTATLRHAIITQPDDDGLDWDLGWSGNVQWLIVQQNAVVGNYAFESDNNGNDNDATPRSSPTLWNVTLVGSDSDPGTAGKLQGAMMLRRGTAGSIHNAILTHFSDLAVDVADHATVEQAMSGALTIRSSYFHDNANDDNQGWPADFDVGQGQENDCETPAPGCTGFDEAAFFTGEELGNVFADPELVAPLDLEAPRFAPAEGSPVLSDGATPGAGFDASATYVGAVGESDWTEGWTSFPAN